MSESDSNLSYASWVGRPAYACRADSADRSVVLMRGYDGKQWSKQLDCGSCFACENMRRRRIIARIIQGAVRWRDFGLRFTTFTFADRGICPVDAASRWRKLRHLLNQRALDRGKRFRYFWVLELQKDGTPHYHLVHTGGLWPRVPRIGKRQKLAHWLSVLTPAQRRWIATLERLGFGPVTHTERVRKSRASGRYLAKYLGKTQDQIHGCCHRPVRLFGCSRDWNPPPKTWQPVIVKGQWFVNRAALPQRAVGTVDYPDLQGARYWRRLYGQHWHFPRAKQLVQAMRDSLIGTHRAAVLIRLLSMRKRQQQLNHLTSCGVTLKRACAVCSARFRQRANNYLQVSGAGIYSWRFWEHVFQDEVRAASDRLDCSCPQ